MAQKEMVLVPTVVHHHSHHHVEQEVIVDDHCLQDDRIIQETVEEVIEVPVPMAQEEIMHVPMAHAQVETDVATDEAAMIQIFQWTWE